MFLNNGLRYCCHIIVLNECLYIMLQKQCFRRVVLDIASKQYLQQAFLNVAISTLLSTNDFKDCHCNSNKTNGTVGENPSPTIAHINIAGVAEIVENKNLVVHPTVLVNGRAGGGRSPLGEAIRRPPRRGEVPACQTHNRGCRSRQSCQELSRSSLHLAANLLPRSF